MKRDQLSKFIKRRNESDFQTNLQFEIDIRACGLEVDDLGKAKKVEDGSYEWTTPFGKLVEKHGKLSLVSSG